MKRLRSKSRRPRPAKRRTPRTRLSALARGFAVTALLILAAAAAGLGWLWSWAHSAPEAPPEVIVWAYDPTTSGGSWPDQLARAGKVSSPLLLEVYAALRRPGWKPPAGEHLLTVPVTPDILLAIVARTGARPRRRLVIPEGFNRFQIAARLEAEAICTSRAAASAMTDRQLLQQLGVPATSAEGYLFPATYQLYVNSGARAVVRTLVRQAQLRLSELGPVPESSQAAALGWGMHEVVTLASIIEKESSREAERGLIASVFFNRLQSQSFLPRRMLQSDPTAGYGCLLNPTLDSCRNYRGRISAEMLRDEQNLYNTYRHAGLPPGPIANPGQAAIRAVLHPAPSDYLFFVARPSGEHQFSRTLSEHRRATRKR